MADQLVRTTQLSETTRRRLNIQGFESVPDKVLSEVAPWQRLAFALCSALAVTGTILASSTLLGALAVIAALAAVFPVHPFDLIYNHGIRYLRGTGPLPKRGAPGRFGCGLGAVWLVGVIFAFQSGNIVIGFVLGGLLTAVAGLVALTDICIPSMIYQAVFGRKRALPKACRDAS
jgi:hypothetical protein